MFLPTILSAGSLSIPIWHEENEPVTVFELAIEEDHMQQQDSGAWSPYLAGALSGLAGIFSVWFAGQYFGAASVGRCMEFL